MSLDRRGWTDGCAFDFRCANPVDLVHPVKRIDDFRMTIDDWRFSIVYLTAGGAKCVKTIFTVSYFIRLTAFGLFLVFRVTEAVGLSIVSPLY